MLTKVRSQKLAFGNRRKIEKRLCSIVFILLSLFFSIETNAQCAMCRAALAGESNKATAEAVNDGIVYLMVIPYLLVAGIGYYIYRMRKKKF
jgi:hypothetical protein